MVAREKEREVLDKGLALLKRWKVKVENLLQKGNKRLDFYDTASDESKNESDTEYKTDDETRKERWKKTKRGKRADSEDPDPPEEDEDYVPERTKSIPEQQSVSVKQDIERLER